MANVALASKPAPTYVFHNVPRKALNALHAPGHNPAAGVPVMLHIQDSHLIAGESSSSPLCETVTKAVLIKTG